MSAHEHKPPPARLIRAKASSKLRLEHCLHHCGKARRWHKDGKAISPNSTTIEDGSYNPFSRPLFIYANAKSARKPHVRAFIEFYLTNAPKASAEVGYVGLPSELYDRARKNVNSKKTGTQYLTKDGEARHGALSDLYR